AEPEHGATPQVAAKRKRTSGLPRQDRAVASPAPPTGASAPPPARKRWLPLAVAAGVLLVIGVASTFFLSGSPAARTDPSLKNPGGDPALKTGTERTPLVVGKSFLDQLDPARIP